MSGTSADGVDAALVEIEGRGLSMRARLLHHFPQPYGQELRSQLFAIRQSGPVALSELAAAGRKISLAYADAVQGILNAAQIRAAKIEAVCAHGQTLFHAPPDTIQWLDPALLAQRSGCRVISDFRRADCAAGGQGAPLVPFADYILFRDQKRSRVLLNLGGIANVTWLPAAASLDQLIAFDTGPANCLSDYLMRRYRPDGPGFDDGGALAGKGQPIEDLVRAVLADQYFSARPPKSTDGPAMIALFERAASAHAGGAGLADLLASANAVAATAVLRAIEGFDCDQLIVSGGGTQNMTLMRLIAAGGKSISTTDEFGVPSAAKEALAFALLGAATLDGVPANVPSATGASRPVVLGSVTPRP